MTAPGTAPPTAEPRPGCPKHMVFGPCGGVEADGRCEVDDRRCVFLDNPHPPAARRVSPTTLTPAAAAMRELMARRQVVVADFPARAMDLASSARCAGLLAGTVDAVLVGDAPTARVQFPPAFRASLIIAEGLPVWAGLNCRDRNRVALEGELAALAAVGVSGVHCVTGDHTTIGNRPDATPVFDLDSTRLAGLASAAGHLVSVAESPASPPIDGRAARLVEKERAGATVVFVNHCGDADRVATFLDRHRAAGGAAAPIACVPLVVDAGSADLLRSFTSLVLPPGYLQGISSATDPFRAGVDATVALAERMLAVPGVRGVDLSGGPAPGAEETFAQAIVDVAARLR